MNLWLSPQGLWYYRKVTLLPVVVIKSGRRNGIKHPCQPETSWQPVQVVNILSWSCLFSHFAGGRHGRFQHPVSAAICVPHGGSKRLKIALGIGLFH
ncbi:hypothetical protein ACB316_10360 [Aeromonas sanarellii]|nr:hypothetical protein KXJ75_11120 [Aeromonas sanarellii]